MSDILLKLETLNREQLNKVAKLIDKLYEKNQKTSDLPPAAPEPIVKPVASEPQVSQGFNKRNPTAVVAAKSGKPKKPERGAGGKRMARPVPINSDNSDNQFFKIGEGKKKVADMFQEDTKIDKLLNVCEPVPRTREAQLVEVECIGCENIYTVHPDLIPPAGYTCDDCILERRRK